MLPSADLEMKVRGKTVREYLYSRDHGWVEAEGRLARVGISEFAQKELGEIAYLELPELGRQVRQGEAVCSIDSLKSTSEIYAPVSGKVVGVNERLRSGGGCALINTDPLGEGWIFILEMSDPGQLGGLLSAEAYSSYVAA